MDEHKIFSSQITFLNFRDFEAGKSFVSGALGLQKVYDIGWAAVYRAAEKAYLGVVDHSCGKNIGAKGGVLISLTSDSIDALHSRISDYIGGAVSPIEEIPDAGLRSFFFTGPEGFNFEIEQFILPEARELF